MEDRFVRSVLKMIIIMVLLGIYAIMMTACTITGSVNTKTHCHTGSKATLVNECIRERVQDM